MNTRRTRKIVKIDEEKCSGCGDCVPSCAEGAIKIVDGKAKLVADKFCDGLGACLGHCPMDAITVEEREAEDYDHHAVEQHLGRKVPAPTPPVSKPAFAPAISLSPLTRPGQMPAAHGGGGCPGSRMRTFEAMPASAPSAATGAQTALRQWPVQLTLLPPTGPLWLDKDVLIAADCVPFAYPEFHSQMLAGKTLAIACPKLDEVEPYVQKLATIFATNSIKSVTVARMEVPCCSGLTRVVQLALQQSGAQIPFKEVIVGIRGQMQQ